MAGRSGDSRHEERRVGRRSGDSGTRETILATALEMFADNGYAATSVRAIAKQAEVDPALIRHFFGNKKELFATAVIDRSEIADRVAEAFDSPTDGLGERLVRTYFSLWESPDTGPVLQTLFRSAVVDNDLTPMFVHTMFSRLQEQTTAPEAAARVPRIPLIVPHVLGVALCRYVLKMPMIADEPLDDLVARLAPQVQRELTDTP
jgi:AcrR family transcriptional regulator